MISLDADLARELEFSMNWLRSAAQALDHGNMPTVAKALREQADRNQKLLLPLGAAP